MCRQESKPCENLPWCNQLKEILKDSLQDILPKVLLEEIAEFHTFEIEKMELLLEMGNLINLGYTFRYNMWPYTFAADDHWMEKWLEVQQVRQKHRKRQAENLFFEKFEQ